MPHIKGEAHLLCRVPIDCQQYRALENQHPQIEFAPCPMTFGFAAYASVNGRTDSAIGDGNGGGLNRDIPGDRTRHAVVFGVRNMVCQISRSGVIQPRARDREGAVRSIAQFGEFTMPPGCRRQLPAGQRHFAHHPIDSGDARLWQSGNVLHAGLEARSANAAELRSRVGRRGGHSDVAEVPLNDAVGVATRRRCIDPRRADEESAASSWTDDLMQTVVVDFQDQNTN